jgi:hypothetical protein
MTSYTPSIWPHTLRLYDLIRSVYMTSYAPSIWPHTLRLYDHTRSVYMTTYTLSIWPHTLRLYDFIHSVYMTTYTPSIWPHTLRLYDHIRSVYMTTYTPSIWPHTLRLYDLIHIKLDKNCCALNLRSSCEKRDGDWPQVHEFWISSSWEPPAAWIMWRFSLPSLNQLIHLKTCIGHTASSSQTFPSI